MKAYVINLDHRTDRWAECQDLPFELIRYRALPHQHGWKGLLATMHELFNAIDGPALILEDDAVMVRDINNLHRAIADLPVPIDEYYRVEIHPRGRSYICNPMVAYQRASHSDIMGTMADYHDIFEHSNSLLK
jgi:hypothetical protein